MIDKTKFLEPTEKYIKENSLITDRTPDICKDWFNIDLIFFAVQYKNSDYQEAIKSQEAYGKFCEFYDITITMEELYNIFGEYPIESFNELMRETVLATSEKIN